MTARDPPADAIIDSNALPTPDDHGRSSLRIRPTDDPLSAPTVESHVRRLHSLTCPDRCDSFLGRLRGNGRPATVECLLVSAGDPDATITYAFGIDDPGGLGSLEKALRVLVPNEYEFERGSAPIESVDWLRDGGTIKHAVAVEFCGRPERRNDWQTRLTPFIAFTEDDKSRVPLAAIVETMAEASVPMVYQALLRPKPDWSALAEERQLRIESHQDTLGDQLTNAIFGEPESDTVPLPAGDEARLEELRTKDARHSFEVNARVVAFGENDGDDPRAAIQQLTSAFSSVGHSCYAIEGSVSTGTNAREIVEDVTGRCLHNADHDRLRTRLPWTQNTSRTIVADASEVPSFVLLDGDALTAAGQRALHPTPGERTTIPRPPVDQLTAYRVAGLTLGHPLTQDGTPDETPLVLPPGLQPLHVGWFGKTGSGKSTSLITAGLDNHAATDGVDVLVDPKGDGMATDYIRAHYARVGHLDNVLYFNCAEVLPAFSFFDVRDEVAAGVPRQTAVEDRVDHYVEILTQIMGIERFEQAVRSPDVIRYLVKALFDPINGDDAFSHRDLHATVRRMHERQSAPSVSDPDLEQALGGVVANRARTFDEIMAGVANRVEKIPVDQRLARIFNHVPEEDDPHFDLADYLDEDIVVVFDTGDLRSEAQRVLALVILSNLWTALRRRKRREPDVDHPLVNVYVEEAASIAVSDLLKTLLAQARGFDCSITLSMQFPAQLRGADETAYDEVLNNVSTFVTGNVPVDRRLAERLATDDMDAEAVGNRLRALRRGQWLVCLPAAFDEPEPRPFLVGSSAPPPGDPDGPEPLSDAQQERFNAELEHVRDRTLTEVGLTLAKPSPASVEDEATDIDELPSGRVDTALPHAMRLPPTVEYDSSIHALRCAECGSRYDPDSQGMRRTIECCSSLDAVNPDDVPLCDLNLKLTPEERRASDYSDRELMFLQAVYNAQQRRYDRLEYDIRYDSMLRLQEYVGIDSGEVEDLLDAGVLRHDTDHPHRLYSVAPDGRELIGEQYRQGVDYGHGVGDLEESSEHVFGMEVTLDFVDAQFVQSPDSDVVETIPYYDIDEQRRLDVAGLDADGNVVLAVEVERVNHDVLRAVPDDFDKMAHCGVEEAIWVVMTRQGGHDVLSVLNDPPDGEPRVEKSYSENTPPQQFRIDAPGLTAIYPVLYVRDTLLDE